MVNLVVASLLALLALCSATRLTQLTRDLTPVVAASNATIGAGAHGYTYAGCYNETLDSEGVRALANGQMESNATTTTATCLSYCHEAGAQFAGLEYGQECWCATYLSALTTKLNESVCDLACVGNTSEICGGRLALTLYNLTGSSSGAGRVVVEGLQSGWGVVGGLVVLGGLVVALI